LVKFWSSAKCRKNRKITYDTPEDLQKGRFPANVMHDGSDVIVNQFPEGAKGSTAPRKRDTVGMFGMPNDATSEYADEGSAARFFYCPKTSKSERHGGLDDHETSVGANGNKWTDQDYRKGDTKPTTERKNTHPTVKPVELMKYLCRLVTPKGGTVLDPFMGSGSTGMAAKDEGFDFIGIEKEEEYFKICESRINRFAPLMDFM
jgi:site-specific DNA-methyltransferase (adenine-specific)